MCLILFAYKQHPKYRLIIAANRDEFYNRPSLPADFWQDCPQVLGGRDLEQGGSWMGISRDGKLAAVTNYRDPASNNPQAKSRGALVNDYLCGFEQGLQYLQHVHSQASLYNGFNLLVGDQHTLWYYSNREQQIHEISSGIYGLSNHLLDTAWPKVTLGKKRMTDILKQPEERWEEAFMQLLTDQTQPPDEALPSTGVDLVWERQLAPIFITSPAYGTRTNTLLLIDYEERAYFVERTYQPERRAWDRREFFLRPEFHAMEV